MITKFNLYDPFKKMIIQEKLKSFPYDLLNEGLIRSIEYEDFAKLVDKLFSKFGKDRISYDLYYNHQGVKLEVDSKFITAEIYSKLKELLNISGYLINYFYLDGEQYNRYPEISELFGKYDEITINMVKRFDVDDNSPLPEYLYHVTENKYLDKIMKKGLIPRSLKKIENHPDRIYVMNSLDGANNFMEVLEDMYPENNYIILKIDTKLLNKLKLYFDPTYFQEEQEYYGKNNYKAYYTYDNIPPYAIKKIE